MLFERRAKRAGGSTSEREQRVRAYLASRFKGGKGSGGKERKAFYKSSEAPMSDVITELNDAIEKAKGLLPRGGTPRMFRVTDKKARNGSARSSKLSSYLMHRRRRELGLDRKMSR